MLIWSSVAANNRQSFSGAVVLTLVVLAERRARSTSRRAAGWGAGVLALLQCAGWLAALLVILGGQARRPDYPFHSGLLDDPFRKPIEQQLDAMPGEHLVLVRYGDCHDTGEEYVYNDADIDHARIVWVREVSGQSVAPLLSYFRNRDVWVFEPDDDDRRLYRYAPPHGTP